MKTLRYLLLLTLIFSAVIGCKNTPETEEENIVEDKDFAYLHGKLAEVAAIDEMMDTSNCAQYSLDYATQQNERYFATLFCDKNGDVHRIEELTSNKEMLITRNRIYYGDKGQIFATISERQEQSDTTLKLVEELNFYDNNGKIERSFKKESVGDFEGDYLPSKNNVVLTKDRVIRAINHEGEFALTFQGIIKTDNLDYLMVGTPGKDGYTSALQIEANTPFIKDVYLKELQYVGKKIDVNFERKVMGNFSYQVFVAAKWKE